MIHQTKNLIQNIILITKIHTQPQYYDSWTGWGASVSGVIHTVMTLDFRGLLFRSIG